MKRAFRIIGAFFLVAGIVVLSIWLAGRAKRPVQARLVARATEAEGYRRAEGPMALEFPRDHGPHPDFRTEWWYYTGNIETEAGQHFGFQLTFFRSALVPPAGRQERASAWAGDQVYMAHLAVTDVAGRRFRAFERFSRGAAGLAGAQAMPYRVWLDDWSAAEMGPGTVRLRAGQEGIGIDLELVDMKGPILQGDQGYSQKGPEAGNASYYYSQTRLATSGTVQVGGRSYPVRGLSWMDREFSTSSLGEDQVGWDWFALQLDDGSEVMLYQLRREDRSVDPFSSGTVIETDGDTRYLGRDEFEIEVRDRWQSPKTAAIYPAQWTIRVPGLDLALRLEPYLADQELNLSYAYWEGAVRVEGERAGRMVRGHGYVEMTGYAGSMQDRF